MNLLLSPRLRGSKFSEKPHGITFQTRCPNQIIDSPRFLKEIIFSPRAQGYFVNVLVHINKTCLFDGSFHGTLRCERAASPLTARNHVLPPAGEMMFRFQRSVFAVQIDVELHLLNPTARLKAPGMMLVHIVLVIMRAEWR
jgi:hypothetical protein